MCAPAPLQIGVAEGIRQLPESFYDEIGKEYVVKRDQLCNVLKEIGLTPSVPKGAYYVLADASILGGKLQTLRGRCILLATHDQLPTALALRDSLQPILDINRCVAEGLAQQPQAAGLAQAVQQPEQPDVAAGAGTPRPQVRVMVNVSA